LELSEQLLNNPDITRGTCRPGYAFSPALSFHDNIPNMFQKLIIVHFIGHVNKFFDNSLILQAFQLVSGSSKYKLMH
jgi:hypothetical protein